MNYEYIDVADEESKKVFGNWVTAVNSHKETRIPYDKYREIAKFFLHHECPGCGDDLDGYDTEIKVSNELKGSIECPNCGRNYSLPDHMTKAFFPKEFIQVTTKKEDVKEEVNMGVYSGKTVQNTKNEGGNNMFNINAMFKGIEFGPVKGDAFKLSTLGIAFKGEEGYVVYNAKTEEMTDVTGMTFDMDGMIFAMPVAHKSVSVGDIVVHNKKTVVVKEVKDKTIVVVHPFDSEVKEIIPVKNMFGFNFYTKITPLMDMSSMSPDEDEPFGNLMPMMMMSQMMNNKGTSDANQMNPMMMMALMGNGFGGDGEGILSKEMMMMMAFSGGNMGGNDNMMSMMMMSQMMGKKNKKEVGLIEKVTI